MYAINFKKIMLKKKTSITEISKATGISRSTLTLLSNGTSKGIQFDTLEKICYFLDCTPNDLIKIAPDSYSVQVPLQKKNNKWIYALAVKESLIENDCKNNVMYNADENELPFIIRLSQNELGFPVCYIGVPLSTEKNVFNLDFNKTQKVFSSLTLNQAINICEQSLYIFLNDYLDKKSFNIFPVIFNSNDNSGKSNFGLFFNIIKNENERYYAKVGKNYTTILTGH